MRLLVVSHPCVTPVNQKLYATVERQTDWDVTLVAPASWDSEYGTRHLERWPTFEGALHAVPVALSGNVPLHVYRSTFLPLLHDVQPDAIYVHNEPYAASTAQVLAAHWLSQADAAFGFYSAQNIQKSYPPPFRWTEQQVYRASSFAFPCSETVNETLRAKGYTDTTTRLPLGVDSDRFDRAQDQSAPPALNAPDASVIIGFAGRVVEEKGLDTFMDALGKVRNLSWHFVILGDGDFVPELKRKAKRLGLTDRVSFLGYIDHEEVPRYLAAMDLAVLPSETQPNWKEQFGRVIVEALAAGTPVLGSDSGEIPRLLDRTQGGLTFPEGRPHACAERLARLVEHPSLRKQLAHRGEDYVTTRYTHEHLAQSFAKTIRSAA